MESFGRRLITIDVDVWKLELVGHTGSYWLGQNAWSNLNLWRNTTIRIRIKWVKSNGADELFAYRWLFLEMCEYRFKLLAFVCLIVSRLFSCSWRVWLAFGRWFTIGVVDDCIECTLSSDSMHLNGLSVGVEAGDSIAMGGGSGGGDVLFRCGWTFCCHRKRPSANFSRT